MREAKKLLKEIYGYDNFREGQEKILESVLKRKDTLGIMTTGAGKSLCYQIPALIFDGLTIVISPLISLMKDQVDALNILGVNSSFLNSSLSRDEYTKVVRDLYSHKTKILYLAPERLLNEKFISFIKQFKISMIAVDEAHCISQWGHDFRKSYLLISDFIKKINQKTQILALTATATKRVKIDIVEKLNMRSPFIYVDGFDRENIFFRVQRNIKAEAFIIDYLKKNKNQSGIVYASTRKEVDSIYSYLKLRNYEEVGKYHGGLDKAEKEKYQNDFLNDKIKIMVATNAFGMGIDKSNIRFVIHANIPKDLESYYQEAGRSGRDGAAAEAILIYNEEDISTQKFLIEANEESDNVIKIEKYKKLEEMISYAEIETCFREHIMKYFGDKIIKDYCGNCGNCKHIKDTENLSVEAMKVISCVGRAKENLGISTITNVLLGKADSKMKKKSLEELSTFGIMNDKDYFWIEDFINYLITEKYLEQSAGSFPVVKLGDRYKSVLQKKVKVMRKTNQKVIFDYYDNDLFKNLNELRLEVAKKENVAPYVIFSDLSLIEMAELKPENRWEMLKIKGVGNQKFNNYGELFLNTIKAYKG